MSTPELIEHASAAQPSAIASRWDERYEQGQAPCAGEVDTWIAAQQRYLSGGRALDAACGAGRHTLWLAQKGYEVDAVDLSGVGLMRLAESSRQLGVSGRIRLIHADLAQWQPVPVSYDLVLVSRYLDRAILPGLMAALKPAGFCSIRRYTRIC